MTLTRPWLLPLELPPEPLSPDVVVANTPIFLPAPPKATENTLISTQTERPETELKYNPCKTGKPKKSRLWPWFAWPALFLLTGILLEEMVLFLQAQYRIYPLMGLTFALLLALITGALITAARREWLAIRTLNKQNILRQKADRLMAEESFGNAMPFLAQVTEIYQPRPDMQEALERFRSMTQPHLGDQELLSLFSSLVLRPLDEAALRIIGRHAASAALFAVISPLAILDALIFFWRNIRMTREISYLYGLRPGLTGSLILTRSVAEGMVAAGIGELITHSAADALGDALAGAALAGAGQAASNALFTARTGLMTLQHCRPIPFPNDQKPGLNQIRQELKAALNQTHQTN